MGDPIEQGDTYEIRITPHARRSLQRLKKNREVTRRLLDAIDTLSRNPRPPGSKKLISSKFDNLFRIRVGDWRILYAIEDDVILVIILDVLRRDQAYRGI
jgi:mRNA interferase RelE/StbE